MDEIVEITKEVNASKDAMEKLNVFEKIYY
jgi:hypothetical protein